MKSNKLVYFSISIIISIAIYFIADNYKIKMIEKYQNNKFNEEILKIKNEYELAFIKFINNSKNITTDYYTRYNIKEDIFKSKVELNYFDPNDRFIKLFNANGDLLYNSIPINLIDFEDKNRDKYIQYILRKPMFTTDVYINTTGLFLKVTQPVISDKIDGIFEMRFQFDELSYELSKKDIKLIILLNKYDSKNVKVNFSYSRSFIDNRYVINKNSDKYYLKVIEQNLKDLENQDSVVNKDDGVVIVKMAISHNANSNIATSYIIKPIDEIDLSADKDIKNYIDIITLFSILLINIFMFLLYKIVQTRDVTIKNLSLLEENKKLEELSDKLDFNEKKLSNLFNLQPNIMFISNGVSIIQVNKRFMGFFRRYGTFANFKKRHRDISDLFEPYEEVNYINSGLIDGKNWLEYILENPKKLYKVVMSVDDEPHHFIIKVNEMDFVKQYKERYILVAFVDITQDVNNRKHIIKSSNKVNLEDDTDITYSIESTLTVTINDITNLTPTKQSIFKSNKDELLQQDILESHIEISSELTTLKWKLFVPISTISYISNIMELNYDGRIENQYSDDIAQTFNQILDLFTQNLRDTINFKGYKELSNIEVDHLDIVQIDKDELVDVDIYKFVLFLESKEVDFFILFDKNSLQYIKQIEMLGLLFGD